jgi:hypothetical protein
MLTRSSLSWLEPVLLGACAVLLSACSGPRVADAASIAEAKKVPPPVMQGETTFFGDKLLVEVNLGRGFRPRLVRSSAMFDREPADGRSVFDTDFTAEDEAEAQANIWQRKNSTLPPVALRLRVHNTTAAPVEIEFLECKSYLGNFAVRPEKITIAPGESGQPDAMVSLLGISGQEIPVTVSLRMSGQAETRTVVIVPVKPAAGAPARSNAK